MTKRLFAALVAIIGISCLSMAQTSWVGGTNSKWSKSYNWTNGVPDESTAAIIGDSNFTGPNQPELDKNGKCLSLTIGNEAIACTLSTKRNLTVYGDFHIGANGVIEADWKKAITLEGDWINQGEYLPTHNDANVTFSGENQSIIGATSFNKLRINNSSAVTLQGDIDVDNELELFGLLDPTVDYSVTGSGDIDVKSTGELMVQTATFTENYPISGTIDLDRISCVEYASPTLTQTISSAFSYGRLKINGGSTKELSANLPDLQSGNGSSGQILVLNGVLDLKGFTANRASSGGNIVLAEGTSLRIGGTGTFPQNYSSKSLASTSTVEYYGDNQNIEDVDYGNLVFSATAGNVVKTMPSSSLVVFGDFTCSKGTGTSLSFTALNSIDVKQDISIGQNVTFNGASFTHAFRGDWINEGVFTGGTSTCEMRGVYSTLSGLGTNDFFNVHFMASNIEADGTTLIQVSGALQFLNGGSFKHNDGGLITFNGASNTISANGIDLYDVAVSGNLTNTSDITIRNDLSVGGTMNCTDGVITLPGSANSFSGLGGLTFYQLSVDGHITTDMDFNITNDLIVSPAGSLTASAGTMDCTGITDLSGRADLFNINVGVGKTIRLGLNSILGVKSNITMTGTFNTLTYAPNTVEYNGTGAQNILDDTYHHLTLETGGTKSPSGNFIVEGNLTISPSVTLDGGSNVIHVYRDWINNGTFVSSTSDVHFASTSTSNVYGETTFNTLTVDKGSNETYIFLKSDITSSNLVMTSGMMDTELNQATVTSDRSGNGIILGTVRHEHTFVDATPYYFEGPQTSVTFNTPVGLTAVSVNCRPKEITDFDPNSDCVNREYVISTEGGSYTDATLRLHYEDRELNAFEEPFLTFYRHNTGVIWDSLGVTSKSLVDNWTELAAISALSGRYALSGLRKVIEWDGSESSDWNNAANWTTLSGTDMSNRVPTSTDAIQIGTVAFPNHPTVNLPQNVAALTFGDSQAVTVSLNDSLIVEGNLKGKWSGPITHTINVGDAVLDVGINLNLCGLNADENIDLNLGNGLIEIGSDLNQSGSCSIVCSGSGEIILEGDFNNNGGVFTAGSGTFTYAGPYTQQVAPLNYFNLSMNKSNEQAIISSPTQVGGNLTLITGGRFQCADSISVTGDINIGVGTSFTQNGADISLDGNWQNNGSFLAQEGTVRFTGSGNQTVDPTTFNGLLVDKTSGLFSLNGDCYIKGDLSVNNGEADLGTFVLDRTNTGGSLTLNSGAILKAGGADNFPNGFNSISIDSNSTVEYNGTIAQTVRDNLNYGHLTFSNGGVNEKSIFEDVQVDGDLLVNAGASLTLDDMTLRLNGSISNSGTIDPMESTLILDGGGKQINGPLTLHSLNVNGSYTVNSGTTSMTGNLFVDNTGNINFGSNDAILDGDLTNKGVIISGGTATFTGTRVQSIQLLNAISSTSSGVINFNGTVAPYINSASSPSFATVNINNTGGISPSVPWTVFVAFNVANGASFNGGALNHTFYRNFTNNGTVTSAGVLDFRPGAPYSASGTVVLDGTSFISTGDVVFGGSAPLTVTSNSPVFETVIISNTYTSGITAPNSWTINNELQILSGSTFNAGAGNSHVIGNSLLNNGTLDGQTSGVTFTGLNAYVEGVGTSLFDDLTIDNGASLTLEKEISISGDLVNDGAFVGSGRRVTFTGSSSSSVSGLAGSISFGEFETDKDWSMNTTLNIPVTVEDELIMTSGNIMTDDTNLLTLQDDAVASSGHDFSYVDGPMEKIGNDAFVFPIGNDGRWARLGISAPALSTDGIKAEYFKTFYSDTTSMATSPSPVLNNVSKVEYWNCEQSNGTPIVNVELFWVDAATSGINDFSSDLVVAHWNGSAWENAGQSAITGGTSGSVTSDLMFSFSPFTLGSRSSTSNPLPVELVDFKATPEGRNVRLTWTTLSEINNEYFTIERSKDAEYWEVLSIIPGAGTSSEVIDYKELDQDPYQGISYYRLKQTDHDGGFEYSEIRIVDMNASAAPDIKIFPNPTDGILTVMANEDERKEFRISTILGQDMTSLVQVIDSAASIFRLDLNRLKPGIYILSLNSVAFRVYKK